MVAVPPPTGDMKKASAPCLALEYRPEMDPFVDQHLQGVSRTYALLVPLLPQPATSPITRTAAITSTATPVCFLMLPLSASFP